MIVEQIVYPGATAEGQRSSLNAAIVSDLRKDDIATRRMAEGARTLIATRALQAFAINPQPEVNGAISVGEGLERVSRAGILAGEISTVNHPSLNRKGQFIARSIAIIETDGTMAVYPDGYDDGVDFDSRREATDDEVIRVKRSALKAILRVANQTYNRGIVSLG